MRVVWFCLFILIGLGFTTTPGRAQEDPRVSVVTLLTRGEVTQSFLLMQPNQPVAAAILFAGGPGRLPLMRLARGEFLDRGNFLVRIRYEFFKRNIMLAIVDAPSDRQDNTGMQRFFRAGPEHAKDIAAVVAHLRTLSPVPIWLIGTSAGTESVASIVTKSEDGIGGIVLTSSMTVTTPMGPNVLDLPLERVRVPALVVAHQGDACRYSPPHHAERIIEKLSNANRKAQVMIEGGHSAMSEPCEALSAHGFYGVEVETVDAIVGFMTKP
jgi:pimeloyl-ACP methyl ester carboxylesterase